VFKVDDDIGVSDFVIDPIISQVLYVSIYQWCCMVCCMNGGGSASGVWKSIDAGEIWTRMKAGLFEGFFGWIGFDVYRKRPNILYVSVEGSAVLGGCGGRGGVAVVGDEGLGALGGAVVQAGGGGFGRGGGSLNSNDSIGFYRLDDVGVMWKKVNNANSRPMYFS